MNSNLQPNSNRSQLSAEFEQQIQHLNNKIFSLEASLDKQNKKLKACQQRQQDTVQVLDIVINNIPQSVYWKDHSLTFRGCSESFAQDLNIDGVDNIIGKTDYDLSQSRAKAEKIRFEDLQIMELRAPRKCVVRTRTNRQGNKVLSEISKIPLINNQGSAYGIVCIAEDLDAIEVKEPIIDSSENLASNPIGIANIDPDNDRFSHVNQELSNILGYSLIELKDKNFLSIFHPQDYFNLVDKLGQIKERKITEHVTKIRAQNQSGNFIWVEIILYWNKLTSEEKFISLVLKDIGRKEESQINRQKEKVFFRDKLRQLQKDNLLVGELLRTPAIIRGETKPALAKVAKAIATHLSVQQVSIWSSGGSSNGFDCDVFYDLKSAQCFYPNKESVFRDLIESQLLNTEGLIKIDDFNLDPNLKSYFQKHQIASIMNIFVVSTDKKMGVISLRQTGELRVWTPEEKILLTAIANILAFLFEGKKQIAENKLIWQKYRRAIVKDKLVTKIFQSLGNDGIFEKIVNLFGKAFNVDRCYFVTYEGIIAADAPIVAEYITPGFSRISDVQIPVKNNLYLGAIFAQDGAANFPDVYKSNLLEQATEIYSRFQVKSLLAVRTVNKGEINGCLNFHQCSDHRSWTDHEINLIETLANRLGIILAQTNLIKKRETQCQRLKQHNHKLTRQLAIIETSSDGMGMLQDGKFIYLNQAFVELFGYDDRQELIGKNWLSFYRSEQISEIKAEALAILDQLGSWRGELKAINKQGSIFDTEVTLTVNYDHNIICVCRDITERKQAEIFLDKRLQRELLLSQITYEIRQSIDSQSIFQIAATQIGLAFQANRCGIYSYDIESTKTIPLVAEHLAAGFESLWGTEILVQGNIYLESVLEYDRAISFPNVYQESLLQELSLVCQKMQLKSLLVIRTSYQGKPNGFIEVHQCDRYRVWTKEEIDLLEEVAVQVGIALAQAELLEKEQKQRQALEVAKREAELANSAKSEFLAKMSHELRTPLNVIIGFSQLMRRQSEVSPKQKETLDIINRNGEQLLNLINDVLDMSKIEAGKIELNEISFDLPEMLHNLRAMFWLQASSKNIDLVLNLDSSLPRYVNSDRQKLRQILINLLNNAIKFTDRGNVTLAVKPLDAVQGDKAVSKAKINILFEVIDTGAGIGAKELDNLFEAFTQTDSGKKSNQGTGLGLAISKTFVELLQGQLMVNSQQNQGSTFSFTLPLETTDISTEQITKEQTVIGIAPQSGTRRILIVDDSENSRILLSSLLQDVGFEVKQVADGATAISICQQWRPDLIFMDIQMPLMDGSQAIAKIKQLAAETNCCEPVIIVITANGFKFTLQELAKIDCHDLIHKPCSEIKILTLIAKYLQVEYLYQSDNVLSETAETQSHQEVFDLKMVKQKLSQLEADTLDALYQASLCLDEELTANVINKINAEDQDLGQWLNHHLGNFQFEDIIEKIETVLEIET